MIKTEATALLTKLVEEMEQANRANGIRLYSWKMYTTCPNIFYVLERDVRNPDPRWVGRPTGSESVVLNPVAFKAMVALAKGGEKEVLRLMVKAMINVTNKPWAEIVAIVTEQAAQAA